MYKIVDSQLQPTCNYIKLNYSLLAPSCNLKISIAPICKIDKITLAIHLQLEKYHL
jgi:hypothetical protein